MVVRGTQAARDAVAARIKELTALLLQEVRVDVYSVTPGPETPAGALKAAEVDGVLGGEGVGRARERTTLVLGQPGHLRSGRSTSFVSDYDVEVAEGAAIGKPVIRVVQEGLDLRTSVGQALDGRLIVRFALTRAGALGAARDPRDRIDEDRGRPAPESPVFDGGGGGPGRGRRRVPRASRGRRRRRDPRPRAPRGRDRAPGDRGGEPRALRGRPARQPDRRADPAGSRRPAVGEREGLPRARRSADRPVGPGSVRGHAGAAGDAARARSRSHVPRRGVAKAGHGRGIADPSPRGSGFGLARPRSPRQPGEGVRGELHRRVPHREPPSSRRGPGTRTISRRS